MDIIMALVVFGLSLGLIIFFAEQLRQRGGRHVHGLWSFDLPAQRDLHRL